MTSAVLTIPVSMGYGILALYPLGERYVSYGPLAGLYCAIVVPIVAVLLGADTPMMYAPRSVVAFLLSSIVLHGLVRSRAGIVDLGNVGQTLRTIWPLLPSLVTGALSLAIVASLDGLLCAKTVEGVTGEKTGGNRELVRLGVENMAAACFGGISSGVNLGSSFANYRSGGRTPASVLVTAVALLLAVLLLPPVIAFIPRMVIAGLLLVVGLQLFDRWSILRRILGREFVHWNSMTVDLLVILLVATVAIASNLVVAVGIGVGITILSFLFRMSRSAVRREYRGDVIHSRRTRDPRHMEVLSRRGSAILVLELEGPVFFGTAEELAGRVDAAVRAGVSHVVLDLKRVNEVDTTGARILLQIEHRLVKGGRHLLVSHADRSPRVAGVLQDMGVLAAIPRQRVFHDTDRALEWAEDHLIASEVDGAMSRDDYALDRLDVLVGLSVEQADVLRILLIRKAYRKGETVFQEGDEGRDLYIIVRGTASVKIRLSGEARENRLATFSAGTVFGELALLDQQRRSATVEADEDLVCYVLTEDAFEALKREHGDIAITLLTNLGRELSRRLRGANRTIYELEG